MKLRAHLSDELNWSAPMQQAEAKAASGEPLLWEIDLGLSDHVFVPNDSAAFYAFSIALEEFTAAVYQRFAEATSGIVLYRGSAEFAHHVPRTHWSETLYAWGPGATPFDHSLFGATVLAEYLQRLISFLPDEVPVFGHFDTSQERSYAEAAQKLSSARFGPLQVVATPAVGDPEAALGLCLPMDTYLNESVRAQLDAVALKLVQEKRAFRWVPEEQLTQEWQGLDELIILPCVVSAQGQRKLAGFAAAGGTIIEAVEAVEAGAS